MYDKSFAIVETRLTNMYANYPWNYTFGGRDTFSMLHFAKDLLLTENSFVMMKRGSPITQTVTQFNEILHAMGFPDYITHWRLPIEAEGYGKKLPPPNDTPLSLENLALVFVFWGFGLVLSSTVLALELLFPKTKCLATPENPSVYG